MLGVQMDAIENDWVTVRAHWDHWAATATDEDLARTIVYHDLRGAERRSLASEIVMHVVNHATLHRGQVMSMLRQQGIAPPQTDLITFYRAQTAYATS